MTGPSDREPSKPNVANLGVALARSARSPEDLDCLEVFADLVALESDGLRPHLLTVLLEPDGTTRVLTIGHACPGLTIQLDDDLEFDLPQLWFAEMRVPRRGPSTEETESDGSPGKQPE